VRAGIHGRADKPRLRTMPCRLPAASFETRAAGSEADVEAKPDDDDDDDDIDDDGKGRQRRQ
jgi:hypothetical protein